MGQKVNPISFRVGAGQGWKSRWFAQGQEYKTMLWEDFVLRRALEDRLKLAGLQDVEIERLPKSISVRLRVSRPGVVIGRGGAGVEEIKNFVAQKLGGEATNGSVSKIDIVVEEVKNPETSAKLVAARIISELERRFPHRRVINKAIDRVMAAGAKGVKIVISGRIGGTEISRVEKYHRGSVPTQTIRENIDYVQSPALLKKGFVGIKVWIHKGKDA